MSNVEPSVTVVLGLGGNLGDVQTYFQRSLERLEPDFSLLACSSLYRTKPSGFENQNNFTNAVAVGTTLLGPLAFLRRLQEVERSLGKQFIRLNGPRCIDLDLLFWGDQQLHTSDLSVPHPRAHLRDFVLLPLLEVLPEFRYPGSGETVQHLLELIPAAERYFTGEVEPWK